MGTDSILACADTCFADVSCLRFNRDSSSKLCWTYGDVSGTRVNDDASAKVNPAYAKTSIAATVPSLPPTETPTAPPMPKDFVQMASGSSGYSLQVASKIALS